MQLVHVEREAEVEHCRLGAVAKPHHTTAAVDDNPTRSVEAKWHSVDATAAAEEGVKPPSGAERIPAAEQ